MATSVARGHTGDMGAVLEFKMKNAGNRANHLYGSSHGTSSIASKRYKEGSGGCVDVVSAAIETLEKEMNINDFCVIGQVQENQEGGPSMDLHESQGQTLSPRVRKASEGADLQRSQTIGQRFMDNIFMRIFTSKPNNPASDVVIQPSPSQSVDVVREETEDLTESPFMGTVRGKCITQLLLLGALDSIQGQQIVPIGQQIVPVCIKIHVTGTKCTETIFETTDTGLQRQKLDDDHTWWIDSGTMSHVCKARYWFVDYVKVDDGSILYMEDHMKAPVIGYGFMSLDLVMKKVFVLEVKNLVFGGVLNKCGYKQGDDQI
ncbi:hypothetical protein LXL04_022962 [Taraxacum kok-saghyz]